jgi:riboflavin kinase
MRSLLLQGIVCSGTGEGKYYMSLKRYRNGFKSKLSLSPFPGTLNLELSSNELSKLENLKKSIVIGGFIENKKYFGAVKCFEANVKGINCWLIIPEKTRYKNVVEIICDAYLRDELNLKDGDKLEVEVFIRD